MYVCLYFKRNPLAPKIAKQFHLVFNCFGCGHTYSDGDVGKTATLQKYKELLLLAVFEVLVCFANACMCYNLVSNILETVSKYTYVCMYECFDLYWV